MDMLDYINNNIWVNNEPINNEVYPENSILPERYGNISEPVEIPILPKEFNTLTEPSFVETENVEIIIL